MGSLLIYLEKEKKIRRCKEEMSHWLPFIPYILNSAPQMKPDGQWCTGYTSENKKSDKSVARELTRLVCFIIYHLHQSAFYSLLSGCLIQYFDCSYGYH